MRIAYVCADPGIPVFGTKGASVHVQEVLRGLRRAGAEPVLFASRIGGEPPADLAGLRVVELPPLPKGEPLARARAALDANAAVMAALEAAGPFELVYERYSLWSDAGMVWARRAGCPGLLEVERAADRGAAQVSRPGARRRGVADRAVGVRRGQRAGRGVARRRGLSRRPAGCARPCPCRRQRRRTRHASPPRRPAVARAMPARRR
ncbi:hypothetical protein [Thauera sp.]|uniref:hypothetical protein n=1 Tax=Thauera sp. TaxID=1905334 RepID=UPI0039E27452